MSKPKHIYTLLDVAKSLQSIIGKTYTKQYWIKAEIARLNFYPKSGHAYPDLVYKEEGKIQAEMRSIIWGSDFVKINRKFQDNVKSKLSDGMQILFQATVSYHPKYGLSLTIMDIEPSFTLGEMAREKAETIQRLKEAQIFHQNKRLPFPVLPKRLAVISVSTSKGYHDFLNIIQNNTHGFAIQSYLFSALLQGERCAKSILEKLNLIKTKADYFDAVLIIRGGGGDVGLNAYDDYELTSCIATFPLPVVTGIGHSTNLTIAEMVSHTNKITPTDVAYFMVEKFSNLKKKLDETERLLHQTTAHFLKSHQDSLTQTADLLQIHTKHFIQSSYAQLDNKKERIIEQSLRLLKTSFQHLEQYQQRLKHAVDYSSNEMLFLLNAFHNRIRIAVQYQVNINTKELEQLSKQVELLNPKNVMKRGYSITTLNGKSITNQQQLTSGNEIKTILYNGTIESIVK
ncbi:MAG: exodeoxyribonuclease VII large subunit [Bacteroidetes bacterium]|nr:MAG: exodeoxyribonuclease VII large subunit [Bacteroidota bacterium]